MGCFSRFVGSKGSKSAEGMVFGDIGGPWRLYSWACLLGLMSRLRDSRL